jgi:TRAP-type C4-dicarboxylate transport system substrate-binding protein
MRGIPTTAAIFAAALAGWSGVAGAEETTLIFATTNVPQIHANVRVLHPWAQRMNEQGKGVLKIDVRDGMTLANHVNYYQRALDDVVQLTWGVQSQIAGKFPRSHVAALPFEAETAEQASIAYWRLYKTGLLDAEYDEIVPLMLIGFTQAGVHTAKPLRTLDNLNGLKLTMNSKLVSDAITRLGATPISLPLPDFYEGLQRGTVDGAAIPWTAFAPFKLGEVTTYHVEAQLGNSIGVVFMTRKRYAALPAAARKVVDDNAGEKESRVFGAMWDSEDAKGRDMVKAMGGKHVFVSPTPEQSAKWRERVAPVAADWVKATPGGDKILATWREFLAKAKTGG